MPNSRSQFLIAIGAFTIIALVILYPYLIATSLLPKSEDLEYTVLPSMLLQTVSGTHWNPYVGLGSAWPIPVGFSNVPFKTIFLEIQVFKALALILLPHLAVAFVALLYIFRKFKISATWAALGAITILLGPTLECLYNADAISVYISSLTLYSIFACTLAIRDIKDTTQLVTISLLLGAIVGLATREGHVGVLPIYAFAVFSFVVFSAPQFARKIGFFLLSIAIAVLLGGDLIYFLASEARQFSPESIRYQDPTRGGFLGLIKGLLLWPFAGVTKFSSWNHAFESWAYSQAMVRNLAVGAAISVMVFLSLPALISRIELRPLLYSILFCTIILCAPIQWLPNSISATWPIRDFVALGLVILALISAQERLVCTKPKYFIATQLGIVVIGMIPLVAFPYLVKQRGFFKNSEYAQLLQGSAKTAYIQLLKSQLNEGDDRHPRVIATQKAWHWMDTESAIDLGLVNNVAALNGFSEVSFIAKGLSFDAVSVTPFVPYGVILGTNERLISKDNIQNNWATTDRSLLDFLRIRFVVTAASETVTSPNLKMIGNLKSRDGFDFSIYRNEDFLPEALFVRISELNQLKKSHCLKDIIICYDAGPLLNNTTQAMPEVQLGHNQINVRIAPTAENRMALLPYMFLRHFHAENEHGIPLKMSHWAGLLLIEAPAGTSEIKIIYQDRLRSGLEMLAHYSWIITLALLITLAAVTWIPGFFSNRLKG